jgi:RNA polymerase sigma-70 factor (ECF subfamily)
MFEPVPLPFEEVYAKYAERVFRFCLWQVQDPALAEDIAAETFISAYAAYEKRQPAPDGVRLWLFRIARNLVVDHRRRESRLDRIVQKLGRANNNRVESIEQVAETHAELAQMLKVLAKMKKRDAKLIALRAGAELSTHEVAALLGMSEKAVRNATARALVRFRKLSEGAW